MSLVVSIPLTSKHILLVGGGKVALRKAKSLVKEHAYLHVVALMILDEVKQIASTYQEKCFEEKDLKDMDIVIAATDDSFINQQIVEACHHRHLLCCSVHKDPKAAHVVSVYESDQALIGVSTKGHYPSLSQTALNRMKEVWQTEFATNLALLANIRVHLLSQSDKTTAYELAKKLSLYAIHDLMFLDRALAMKKAVICCFHGIKDKEGIAQELLPFLEQLESQYPQTAFGFTYISKPVLKAINNEQHVVSTVSELLDVICFCHVEVRILPMLFQNGRFTSQIEEACASYPVQLLQSPWQQLPHLQCMMQALEKQYGKPTTPLFILYHSSKDGAFQKQVQSLTLAPTTQLYHEQLLPRKCTGQAHVYFFYMLSGYHRTCDELRIKDLNPACSLQIIKRTILQEPSFLNTIFTTYPTL